MPLENILEAVLGLYQQSQGTLKQDFGLSNIWLGSAKFGDPEAKLKVSVAPVALTDGKETRLQQVKGFPLRWFEVEEWRIVGVEPG